MSTVSADELPTELDSSLEHVEVPRSAAPYILLQRVRLQKWNEFVNTVTGGKSFYNNFFYKVEGMFRAPSINEEYAGRMAEVFQNLRPDLPANVDSVVDIGCGVAGLDVYLWHHYEDPEIVLFDKSEVSDSVYYQFYPDTAWYNSLDVAKETLVSNDVPEESVRTVEASPEALLEQEPTDLVISLYSWGFHYPLETYLDEVKDILSEDGHVIIDLRRDTDGRATCEEHFNSVEIIEDEAKFVRVKLSGPQPPV